MDLLFFLVPDDALLTRLENGTRLTCPAVCAPNVFECLVSCWDLDPQLRPVCGKQTHLNIRDQLSDLIRSHSCYSLKQQASS